MSLSKLKYLNLSGGCVSDDGLKYLNPLWNLDELILKLNYYLVESKEIL